MENESIEAKQQYLRENIIDAGYDAQDFVQYSSQEHNLEDLADWTLEKLKEVVQLYITMKTNSKADFNEKTDDECSNFEEATKVQSNQNSQTKKQHDPSHNLTKTGHLVFSEDDWAIFLGGLPPATSQTTIPLNTQTNNNLNKKSQQIASGSPKKPQELNKIGQTPLKLGELPKVALLSLEKDNPLSPPSQQTVKKQTATIKSMLEEGALKNHNKGPINFTNIKLQTSKVKPVPNLPQINDIIITKTQQMARNFLQSDYTLYYIHFMPGNHVIQRKFSDLRKLRTLLRNLYPHIRLPYLEPEGWLTSSQGKDTETLAKYKWMVLDFLKYIMIRNEQLKNCPFVRKFCGFSTNMKGTSPYEQVSKGDLKKMLQVYDNLPKPKNIGELCLTSNCIVLPPSNDLQKIMGNTTNLLQEIDHEYEKLRKKFDNMFYYYDCVAKAMTQVSASFETLENLIKKYNFDNDEPKELRVYEGIREICNKMHNSMNEQCVVFKTRVKNILRFQKDNMMTLKQLFETRNKIHSEYVRQNYPTLSKSSQSGLGEVQIESNISLEEPSRSNKNNLCVQEIFWSYFTKREINSYFEELRKKINQQLTMISYEELDNENDNLNFWNSMIKKCVV